MGTRSLRARLSARILLVGAVVLFGVGLAALVICGRLLDANDTAAARSDADNGRDSFARELAEQDAPSDAAGEVLSGAAAAGIRMSLTAAGHTFGTTDSIPALAAGACATFDDTSHRTWRACATAGGDLSATAAVCVDAHHAALRTLTAAMAATLILALVGLWFGVQSAIRTPIAELTRLVDWTSTMVGTEALATGPVTTTTEIARLETAFDALLRRILDALARERATSAHMAHELRTPLTAILAELEAIPVRDEAARNAIARTQGDIARLADVIDAILVLSAKPKVTAGFLVNVADLARELAPSNVAIDAPDEAIVDGDERLLGLAIRNLVENAAKYGGGVRQVSVAREGDGVRLSVADSGPGLDPASREKMFERYWRGSADGEGRGLGLALVRAVAERHGGRAVAGPGPDGKGLVVSLFLGGCVSWHEHAEPH
jgi:signal transduction histidine kinase